jgi:hypothetical protein
MVRIAKLFCAALLLCGFVHAESESTERFVVELSKQRIYQGETVLCNFVLYSMEDRLEVEVSKFPEFRGFWSENSALRQGPMMLLPDMRFPGIRKAIIGTYALTPMMGNSDPKVTPMRIVLKNLGQLSGPQEKAMLSEMPPLTILPLPKPPPTEAPYFTAGVGQFHLRADATVIRYYAKEPTALRFSLSGNGNFPELNNLPVQLPPGMALVSQRSSQMGSGPFQNKTFEMVVTIDSETGIDFPPVKMLVFDPTTAQFEMLSTQPIRLESVQRPPDIEQKETIDLGPVEATWHSTHRLENTIWFRLLNVLIAIAWLTLAAIKTLQHHKAKRAADPWVKLKKRWHDLLADQTTEADTWLRQAESLVFDTLNTQTKVPFTTRRQAIQFATRRFGADTASTVSALTTTLEQSYSRDPLPTPPIGQLTPPVQKLRTTLMKNKT